MIWCAVCLSIVPVAVALYHCKLERKKEHFSIKKQKTARGDVAGHDKCTVRGNLHFQCLIELVFNAQ